MDPMMFVELVDRDGNVIARSPVAADAFPVTLRIEGHAAPDMTIATNSDRSAPHHRFAAPSTLWHRLCTPMGALMVSVLTFAVLWQTYYSSVYDNSKGGDTFGVTLFIFALLLLWTGLWALGGRVARNPANFTAQLVWTCAGAVVLIVLGEFNHWAAFLFPGSTVVYGLMGIATLGTVIVLLRGHITIASRMPRQRSWLVSIGTVTIFSAILSLVVYASADRFDTSLRYNASIGPLDTRFIPAESVSDFTKAVGELQEKVDKAAKK
jgi:hypothetical protein